MDPKTTSPLPGFAAHVPNDSPNLFSSLASSFILPYHDFSDSIIHRNRLTTPIPAYDEIYNRVVHPYNTDAFELSLARHNLNSSFPLLVYNFRHGFPLGNMPPLTETIIIPNHISATLHPDAIDKYLTDEVLAGRMSGPFPRAEVEAILRGPFFSSPLIVSVQPQQLGVPDKIRICRHLSKGNKTHPSVNSHINKEDFPTRFDTVSHVADIMSYPTRHSITFVLPSILLSPHPARPCCSL